MDFESARRQFQRLSRLFQRGEISEETFVKGVDDLALTDQEGTEWQIGMQTGSWYRREGQNWIEDDPLILESQPKPDRSRRALAALAVLLLLLLALFSANYYSNSRSSDPDPKGEGSGEESTLAASQATATQPAEGATDEPGGSELTPTLEEQSEPEPTPTVTLLPPPPRVPPQVWKVESETQFKGTDPLIGEWQTIPEYDWEYEFINYEDKEALFLQFTDRVVLWHADLASFTDSDRRLTLALTNASGKVSMACRFNPGGGGGYMLELARDSWALKFYLPTEVIVLAQGAQSDAFQQGEFETFRFRCADETLSAWDSRGVLASVEDSRNPDGALGLYFDVTQGVGVAVVAEDQVSVYQAGDGPAGVGDTVWLDTVEVQLQAVDSIGSADQPAIYAALRIANTGGQPVEIGEANLYLRKGEVRIFPGKGALPTGSDPFNFPLVLDDDAVTGEVSFESNTLGEPAGWQLVLDLRYEGYGEAVFELGD